MGAPLGLGVLERLTGPAWVRGPTLALSGGGQAAWSLGLGLGIPPRVACWNDAWCVLVEDGWVGHCCPRIVRS